MKDIKELKVSDLRKGTNPSCLKFETTKELEPFNGIIGQERALAAIKTAMTIEKKGFNLYLAGDVGIGKTAYALNIINKIAKKQKTPNDQCYVYNFDNPNEPILISLKAGEGKELKEDMNKFVKKLLNSLKGLFSSEDFAKEKQGISERYKSIRENIMTSFDQATLSQGFKIKTTPKGIFFAPVYKDKVLDEKEFSKLDAKTRKKYEDKSDEIRAQIAEVMKELAKLEKNCIDELNNYEQTVTTFVLTKCLEDLKNKYKKNTKISTYLLAIENDVIKNFELFLPKSNKEEEKMAAMIPNFQRQIKKPWENYRVNVIVDNNKTLHAPVVRCTHFTYADLFGKLEYENIMGSLKTDFTMLKAGLIHEANGGYLIVNARDLMANVGLWEAFKRVLKNEEITIDSSRDMNQNVSIISLKPEAIPLNFQVVLIGGEAIYQQLCTLDPDFKKLFKVKADFDMVYDKTDANCLKLAQYVAYVCEEYELRPFGKDAVQKIIEYSSKLSGDKTKLTAVQSQIKDLVIEAEAKSIISKNKVVTKDDVDNAIKDIIYRNSKYDDNLKKLIDDDVIMISTNDKKVGQINGLTIINTGDCQFGKPVRITANTYIGKQGIVNIEREVKMSGTTHSKGVFILSAYIGEKFAQDMPLSLTASICFEQLYNGVDGDSASSTELYAILSSLSGVPIKQNLAVTGSVNQKGEVQAIGGVTEKIEGFFATCKKRGLDGSHGVLIPTQNIINLTLNDEVMEAIDKGLFHIYPVSTIDEGIEILTGIEAGTVTEEGVYPANSVNALAYEKLKKYAEKSKLLAD